MDIKKTGDFILMLRKENNLTQKELAAKLNVTDKAISRWETGKGLPDISLWQTISDVLNISINEILAGKRIDSAEFSLEADKTLIETVGDTKKRVKRKVFILSIIIIILVLFLAVFISLVVNPTFFKNYYSTNIDNKQIMIPIPQYSFYSGSAGMGTCIIKLKTLKEHDEIEVFINDYLYSLESFKKDGKTLYYDRNNNITIWQYLYSNAGIGPVNTICLGFNHGTPEEYRQ